MRVKGAGGNGFRGEGCGYLPPHGCHVGPKASICCSRGCSRLGLSSTRCDTCSKQAVHICIVLGHHIIIMGMVVWFQKSCLAVQNDSAQAIFLFGDLAYADDYNGHSTGQRNGYQPRWDTWGQMMQPIISHLPFISLMGNVCFTFLPFVAVLQQ